MDVVQRKAALGHTISCHRAVNAAGKHVQRPAARANRQPALARRLGAMDVCAAVAYFHYYLKLRLVDIHPQVWVMLQQVGTQLPHKLRAGHGKALICAAGLHLKGAYPVQAVAQILLRRAADCVKILFADNAPAYRRKAEHL